MYCSKFPKPTIEIKEGDIHSNVIIEDIKKFQELLPKHTKYYSPSQSPDSQYKF
jgi:hypothetical protein